MLKRLELVGFKSFADKTQFDFSAGITAIVGPNGSGKSNIVDAVRWTLGEQSAKSLRGGEMSDVIFNGSTSRRSLGLAEVTLTFDNRRRSFATDADDITITRRVYRDGEGEYLINHQLSRLRDVKELFLGTGAGTDAYSIIEQGKVDVLLNASTRERRSVFEEAAGISRFKAKKTESLRKLERVDQNLERLKDITDEVEKQLRSVKLQAAKAQRHQEYSARLRQLRIALGLREYRLLSDNLAEATNVVQALKTDLRNQSAQLETSTAQQQQLEDRLARIDEELHAQEAAQAHVGQQIAAAEATLAHESALKENLETELSQTLSRNHESLVRLGALAAEASRLSNEVASVESGSQEQSTRVRALEDELSHTVERLAELQALVAADKAEHLERMRQAAHLHNDAVSSLAKLDHLRGERDRLRHRTEQAAENLASLDLELQELTRAHETLQERLAAARKNLADQRRQRDHLERLSEEQAQLLANFRAERSGLTSRIDILEALERSQEGMSTGVREVLAVLEQIQAESAGGSPWKTVLGMVADFLTVPRPYAALIDLAVGDRAHQFLVRDMSLLLQALQQQHPPITGRASFRPLVGPHPPDATVSAALTAHPGFVGRAADVVACEHPELASLPEQLLGRTLIVRDLDAARTLAASLAGYRMITLQGELLEADGSLSVGTPRAEAGIMSRRSELRELRRRVAALDERLASIEQERDGIREHIADLDRHTSALDQEIDVLAEQTADLGSRKSQCRERHDGLHEEVSLNRSEMHRVETDVESMLKTWQQAVALAENADREVQIIQSRLDASDRELRDREGQRQLRQQEVTAAKVTAAKVEERLHALRTQQAQLQSDLDERKHQHANAEQHVSATRARLEECRRNLREASESLGRWGENKQAAERQAAELAADREGLRQERQQLIARTQTLHATWRARQEDAHTQELNANELRHRRDALADRLREDYQVVLAELHMQTPATAPPDDDPSAAQEEIADLRRKLDRLGAVNLDSLAELDQLHSRAELLKTQFEDLTSAKRSLEQIIATINADSRRLFTETFQMVRAHFQELFRKLFGGGMADVMLEDENDVLESGIEIMARPPGKELRSISLMSGGEKTLTAVAILLAIFRSKPSPFCILDEVDAALDEANIGRFTAVLREFLDQSQFIIVTHSKKTMAVADALYGVTMQESGISKQVAVRFDDWLDEDVKPLAAAG
jgi:chromosome segregation protein